MSMHQHHQHHQQQAHHGHSHHQAPPPTQQQAPSTGGNRPFHPGGAGTQAGTFETSSAANETRQNFKTAALAINNMYSAQRAVYADGVRDTLQRVMDIVSTAANRNQLNGYVHIDDLLGAMQTMMPPSTATTDTPFPSQQQTPPPQQTHLQGRKRGASLRPEDEAQFAAMETDQGGPVFSNIRFDRTEYPPSANRRRMEH